MVQYLFVLQVFFTIEIGFGANARKEKITNIIIIKINAKLYVNKLKYTILYMIIVNDAM